MSIALLGNLRKLTVLFLSTGGEHLAILRRLTAERARSSQREYFTIRHTCTADVQLVFREQKSVFETLLKDSCRLRDGELRVEPETVQVKIRKRRNSELYNISVNVHVRRYLDID